MNNDEFDAENHSKIEEIVYFICNTHTFIFMILSFVLIFGLLIKNGYSENKELINLLMTSNVTLLVPNISKKD